MIAAELDDRQRRELRTLHGQILLDPKAAKLHCVYVPVGNIEDAAATHVTWAYGTLFQREFSGIGRAELLQAGITVLRPEPAGAAAARRRRRASSSGVGHELAQELTRRREGQAVSLTVR